MRPFVFSAVVGQERLKDALLLNAINPRIGGVLIRGEKGTAKSTLARGLADLLPAIPVVPGCPYHCAPDDPFAECPHCATLLEHGPLPRGERRMPVVTLPTNATEDRVCGTLDLERALQTGQRHFEPGLLAEVHRGILYIDEVNLLDDHIVDTLLDAAAMGVNTVEREGVRMTHPSRFVLIGTMNPEEGDLRPQLLDRFGLCVDVEAILDVESRAEVIRRRLAWEQDPAQFAAVYKDEQRALAQSVITARQALPHVTLSSSQLEQIAGLCVQLNIRSHRADIVIARAAATFAAWQNRTSISDDDIQRAAELALPHRVRHRPFDESTLSVQQISDALEPGSHSQQEPSSSTGPQGPAPDPGQPPGETVFEASAVPSLSLPDMQQDRQRRANGGRHARSQSADRRGRYTRAAFPSAAADSSDIAVDATLRAAAPYQKQRGEASPNGGGLKLEKDDIRVKVREQTVSTLVLLVVDASGSMGAAERMAAAKGACLALLEDAYVRRDRVALIAFRDQQAEVLLQPTDSVELAHERLQSLPTGGQTPLGHGLAKAHDLIRQMRRRDPASMALTVLISDGKANVAYHAGSPDSPFDEAIAMASRLVHDHVRLLVLDTEDDFLTLGLARRLADATDADYIRLAEIEARVIEQAVRANL